MNSQVQEEKARRRFDNLMTVHERGVNDKAIQAYKNHKYVAERSIIEQIGQNYGLQQQQYIQKAFSREDLHSRQNSPPIVIQRQLHSPLLASNSVQQLPPVQHSEAAFARI